MRITIDSHIRIPMIDVEDEVISYVQKHLQFENPNYKGVEQYSENKQYLKYIPQYLYGYHQTHKELTIVRGFQRPLFTFLDKYDFDYKVKDNRTLITAKDKLVSTNLELRSYQNNASKEAVKSGQGIVKMPCGSGKTITLTDIIRRLRQNTLIIVHTNFIKTQWQKYFHENYNYDVGIVQGDRWDLKPYTIAMIQTLAQSEIPERFLRAWGCVVVDECHRTPAETMFRVVNDLHARYRFGTTATARRNDGLNNMIFATLGGVIFQTSAKKLERRDG